MPHNAVTDRHYTGGNRLMLALAAMEKGHSDPRWLTFNQAKALGGQVRKGEHATPIEYWDRQQARSVEDLSAPECRLISEMNLQRGLYIMEVATITGHKTCVCCGDTCI